MCDKPQCKDKRIKVRPVPDWPTYYCTTDGKVYKITELKPMRVEKGYIRVRMNNGKKRILQFVHRIVSAAFDKRRTLDPNSETVDHNDKKTDHNCRTNLEVVTNIVNIHRRWYGHNKHQHTIDIDITKSNPADPF